MGYLEQDARPVTGRFITAGGAAMLKVEQDPVAQLEDVMAGRAVDIDDRTYTAGVMLIPRLVQTMVSMCLVHITTTI
jgi:hypothetical protein